MLQKAIIQQLESDDFVVEVTRQLDPWLPGLGKFIDTHLTFTRNSHIVHLLILHQQERGFWWFGPCERCQGYDGDNEHWVKHEGILDV